MASTTAATEPAIYPVISDQELYDRVASLEYAGAVRGLLAFVIPAMLAATFYVIGATGLKILSTYAVIPMAVILAALVLTALVYARNKNFDPFDRYVPRLTHTLVALALLRGISLGAFMAIALTMADSVSQTAILMSAIMGATLGLTTNLRAISLAFAFPIIFLVWSMTLWLGIIDFWLCNVVFSVMTGLIVLSSSRARAARVDLMRVTLASEQAVRDQLVAEEKLRATEQKAAKRELEQQAVARQMQENLIGAIAFSVVLSHGDEILVVTPESMRQFKIPEGALDRTRMSEYFVDPEDQRRIRELIHAQGQLDDFEVLMHDTEGNQFWVAVSMRPVSYDNQDCWLNSIYNIDARKRMEQELAAAKDSAEQALGQLKSAQQSLIHAEKMASLGQLTAGIAHEIKNPLNFVNNFAKLSAEMVDELAGVLAEPIAAMDEEDRDDAEDLIQTVKDNLIKIDEHGRRADSIVKNMLQHSREGTGEKQLIDLNALAEEAMNLAYHGARANDKAFNVTLETDLSPEVGKIECLPQELQRVILNLCSNGMYEAVKQARNSGDAPLLRVRTYPGGGNYFVEVTDNGGGVPAEIKDKIFQPFFTTKPTGEGTGLGLSMSYDIIKEHGGILSLESELGQGATFRVQLPMTADTSNKGMAS